MLRFIRRMIRHLIVYGFDFTVHLAELPRVFFTRLIDYSGLIKTLEQSGTTRLALVAPHPTQLLEFSMRHLIRGLIDNDYAVVVLMHDHSKATWLKQEFPQIHFAPRKKKGRDFGAWKEIIISIYRSENLTASLKNLLLVNDSLFYNHRSSDLIKRLTDTDMPWSCLYENFEHHYHAQSFLLGFDGVVIRHADFRKFWTTYRPYSSRRHSINNGEVKLSAKVCRTFGPPHCVLRSRAFVSRVLDAGCNEVSRLLVTLNVSPHIKQTFANPLDNASRLLGDVPFKNGAFILPNEVPLVIIKDDISSIIGDIVERFNPTHTVGILANNLWEIPIKRDISVRAHYRISDILRMIKGYSPEEANIIEHDLRSKKVVAPVKGIKRLLFDAGRI